MISWKTADDWRASPPIAPGQVRGILHTYGVPSLALGIERGESENYDVEDGVVVNAPCCCYGDEHFSHPYCAAPTEAILQAERAGLIGRRLDTGWVWVVV